MTPAQRQALARAFVKHAADFMGEDKDFRQAVIEQAGLRETDEAYEAVNQIADEFARAAQAWLAGRTK